MKCLKYSLLLLILLFTSGQGNAQSLSSCPATCSSGTGKDDCFVYSNLSHRITYYPGFSYWSIQDFAGSIAYVDNASVTIRGGLIADDPDFVYEAPNSCLNKEADGTAIGECVLGVAGGQEQTVRPWSESEQKLRAGVQAWAAFPGCDGVNGVHLWTGTMKVCSLTSGKQFYSYSPSLFNTGVVSNYFSTCNATLYDAWSTWGNYVPASWDNTIDRIVLPLATFWHNFENWSVGWQTTVELTNYSQTTMAMTVFNPLTDGLHGHQSTCVQGHAKAVSFTDPVSVPPGQTRVIDLFRDLNDEIRNNVGVNHDSVAFISSDPLVAGMGATGYVTPNSSGSLLCTTLSQ